ncbi:MAG: hypothetical protein DHS20C10_10970 [marine bacterium B5-7]|nr:MAG: hypothetical protein DHS20C10_10970 [marine bacterium B5-7]
MLSYTLKIGRETADIDFLLYQLKAEISRLSIAVEEILNTNSHDGFIMHLQEVQALEHVHMNYPGYRAPINVQFGKIKDNIQLDIGVGDIVVPEEKILTLYKYQGKPIFENAISLQVYSIEMIFSEKLETIISRGTVNSRMKDFHDILLLSREETLIDKNKLRGAIEAVFSHRKTQYHCPISYSPQIYPVFQAYWEAHLRGLGEMAKELELPLNFSAMLDEINQCLMTIEAFDTMGG